MVTYHLNRSWLPGGYLGVDLFFVLSGAVRLVSVDQLVCPTGVPCPARIDGIAVRLSGYDQTHFTAAGATWFAPRFLDLIVDALRSTR